MSSRVHLVISDLFMPQELAKEAYAGLRLPALEKLLARAQPEPLAVDGIEEWMCADFGIKDMAIAPITLRADGAEPGAHFWLRADPVSLLMRRDQLMLQSGLDLGMHEAGQLCASLNAHFEASGMRFLALHPQRWYLQLDAVPEMQTCSPSMVIGRDVHQYLPQGKDALHWHGVLNEIQMLLYEHRVNQAREANAKLPVNSIWFWGGGRSAGQLTGKYRRIIGDSDLSAAFAATAEIAFLAPDLDALRELEPDGQVLITIENLHRRIQNGDFQGWRDSLLELEQNIATPLLQAMQTGKIARITLDILQAGVARRFIVNSNDLWKLWRIPASLAKYALV